MVRTCAAAMAALLPTGMLAAASPAAMPTSAQHAAVLRLPFPQDDGSLTPYTFNVGYSLMTLIYDTVMWRDAQGVPRPWLASAVDTSSDGLTVTIHVAPEAAWQDGSQVTSADIAFTFHYLADRYHPRFTPELSAVASVVTPDAATAVVHLVHPDPGFLQEPLTDTPILPQHLWAGLPPGQVAPDGLPVGSGPYRLTAYEPGKAYRFEAVAGYFRGTPAVQRIDVPIIRDAAATVAAFQRRAVDAIPTVLSTDQTAQLAQTLGTRLLTGESFLGTVLMMNTRQAPFDRLEVRQAVAHAIDLALVTRAAGGGVPAERGYLHPDSGWAPPTAVHEYAPAAARLVLENVAEPVAVLAPDNDPAQQAAGKQVVDALTRAGLRARLRVLSQSSLETALGAGGSSPAFQLALWTAPSLASDDPGMLIRLFGSGQPLDFSGYSRADFDDAAVRAASVSDVASRHSAVEAAIRLLANDVPVVPLYFPRGVYAVRPSAYDGWVYVKGAGILDKLSFVDPANPSPMAATVAPPADANNGVPALLVAALAFLGLGVLLSIFAAERWLRS